MLLEMIRGAEEELRSEETTEERKEFLLVCQFYFVVCFGASLRGCEGFMIERSDLIRHVNRGRMDRNFPHVVVPLLGRFKEETGKRSHLLIMTNKTNSGIAIMSWVERMVG